MQYRPMAVFPEQERRLRRRKKPSFAPLTIQNARLASEGEAGVIDCGAG
jgi:hypothetical protein